MESISKKHTNCRVCGSGNLKPYLDLGLIPLANNLCDTKEESLMADRFPLVVTFCDNCGLSQLSEVVDPKVLFSYYTYRSSVNQGYVDHCRNMANELKNKYGFDGKTFHVDIAGNDGTLLVEFWKVLEHWTLNIDPAKNLCEIAEKNGIESWADFWGLKVGKELESKVDLITATNVFAHLDNVTEFLEACKIALKPEGVIVIENPYWPATMIGNQFDQVYFEHMSYWMVNPMIELCKKVGLHLVDISSQDIHGGTMRYEIRKIEGNKDLDFLYESVFWGKLSEYKSFAKSVEKTKNDILVGIAGLLPGSIVGFAASAKGNTLLNYCGLDYNTIDFICDETPEKIGKFSPGTGIEIKGLESIIEAQPDYILILSWNFKDEIIKKLRPLCPNSKYVLPIPNFEVIE